MAAVDTVVAIAVVIPPTGLRARVPDHAGLTLLLLVFTALLVYSDILWRVDQVVYDSFLRSWSRPAAEDIVVVAIDDASISELGRWPWPRRLHAQLVRALDHAGARAIVFDVVFAQPDDRDPAGDTELAAAMRESARVILPVINEQTRLGGQLLEILPAPLFTSAAAALGHAEIDLDTDGIARGVYLSGGLGDPRWTYLGAAALRFLEPQRFASLPGSRRDADEPASPYTWSRDHHVLIPFAGPPGHYQRISYAQVLHGEFAVDSFRDRIVLVGATATGVGDALPTPVSGLSQPMPGVEIAANVIQALREDIAVRPLSFNARMGLSLLLALLPLPLYVGRTPRIALLITLTLVAGTIFFAFGMLRGVHLWFAPVPALLAIVLSNLLWSWRRLEYTVRYLNRELIRLHKEPALVLPSPNPDPTPALTFVRGLLPLTGWVVTDGRGQVIGQWGHTPDGPPETLSAGSWSPAGECWWTTARGGRRPLDIGIRWSATRAPDSAESEILHDLADSLAAPKEPLPAGTVELIEQRIQQVQEATDRLGFMRRFISESLARMEDGFLVVNNLGQVLLANARAATYLGRADNAALHGMPITGLLAELVPEGGVGWEEVQRKVLLAREPVQLAARRGDGQDLLVHIAPVHLELAGINGMLCNLVDISALKDSERKRNELLNFISHDLRSPLVSILAITELMRQDMAANPESITHIERYARRTLELAEDFVQLSRAESGEQGEWRDVDLVMVVSDAVDQVWAQARLKNISITRAIDVESAWMHGEPTLLGRAIVNLLNNAVKYSPDGASVSVQLRAVDGGWQCCVQDEGYGVMADDISKLFNRYARIRRPRQTHTGGIGLGLALVKVVVDAHGGRIDVESEPDRGSRFCIFLPT